MGLMVTDAMLSGTLLSKLMLDTGLTNIVLRYPLSVLVAYAIFLGLMRLWLAYILPTRPSIATRHRALDSLGLVDPSSPQVNIASWDTSQPFTGFTAEIQPVLVLQIYGIQRKFQPRGSDNGGFNYQPDALDQLPDELTSIVLFVAVVASVVAAGGYLIYIAPQVLPEVAVNAVLASALGRAAKQAEARGWLTSVVKSTWASAAAVLLLTVGLALAIHRHCPTAATFKDAQHCPEDQTLSEK
jgi:hypothetical protein